MATLSMRGVSSTVCGVVYSAGNGHSCSASLLIASYSSRSNGQCRRSSSRTRSSTRRSRTRGATSRSTTTASPTRSSRRAASARTSSPSPRPRRKAPSSWPSRPSGPHDRVEENEFINQVRERVALWRSGGYVGVTRTTRRLLEYWQRADRERRLFFCQIEALETAIYLTEVAGKYGDAWIENELREANAGRQSAALPHRPSRWRPAAARRVVMAMLIAWHTLNKLANPQDARFTDAFLIVTPGITIRDRLRVLLPNDADNYYRKHDLVPPDLRDELGKAKIVITNFHAFLLRERIAAGKLTKACWPAARRRRARSPRRPTRWCAASAASWATSATSSSSTTRRITATGASRMSRGRGREADRRRAQRSREARRRGARLDLRPGSGQGQAWRQGGLRPFGHAVLLARLGLPRRHRRPTDTGSRLGRLP